MNTWPYFAPVWAHALFLNQIIGVLSNAITKENENMLALSYLISFAVAWLPVSIPVFRRRISLSKAMLVGWIPYVVPVLQTIISMPD